MESVWLQIGIPTIEPRPQLLLRHDESMYAAPSAERCRALTEAFALCTAPETKIEDYTYSKREGASRYRPLNAFNRVTRCIELGLS